jgi:thiosulfate dehydrogenase
MRRATRLTGIAGAVLIAGLGAGLATRSGAEGPSHLLPAPAHGGVVVGLCDGETSLEVQGLREGEALSRDRAQAVSDALMAEWRNKNPHADWDDAETIARSDAAAQSGGSSSASAGAEKAGEAAKAKGPGVQVQTYGAFSERDQAIWLDATDAFIHEGDRIFHDAKELGGTIGVSCDMCHPNASNTHPETYPKFQVQFGRVALLRDMINWCIENPVRGKPLHDDDPRLKALEAYILAQRKGVALDYGKH